MPSYQQTLQQFSTGCCCGCDQVFPAHELIGHPVNEGHGNVPLCEKCATLIPCDSCPAMTPWGLCKVTNDHAIYCPACAKREPNHAGTGTFSETLPDTIEREFPISLGMEVLR